MATTDNKNEIKLNTLTIVRDWYHEKYPTDDCYTSILPNITFGDMILDVLTANSVEEMENRMFVPNTYDSIVRERLFTAFSEITKLRYDVFYYRWLYADINLTSNVKIQRKFKELSKNIC